MLFRQYFAAIPADDAQRLRAHAKDAYAETRRRMTGKASRGRPFELRGVGYMLSLAVDDANDWLQRVADARRAGVALAFARLAPRVEDFGRAAQRAAPLAPHP